MSLIQPDEKSSISVIGGEANISDEYVPTLQIEYFFSDNISAELLCCIAEHEVKAENTALGTVDLGKVSHFPPTLTVKYHWTDMGAFQPYLVRRRQLHDLLRQAAAGGRPGDGHPLRRQLRRRLRPALTTSSTITGR